MKAYTDLNQSKELVKILPIESADMMYHSVENEYGNGAFIAISKVITNGFKNDDFYIDDIPCWSLAALLNIIPNSIYDNTDEYSQLEFSKTSVAYHDMNDGIKVGSIKDNLVDACYEMILKLHERKIL